MRSGALPVAFEERRVVSDASLSCRTNGMICRMSSSDTSRAAAEIGHRFDERQRGHDGAHREAVARLAAEIFELVLAGLDRGQLLELDARELDGVLGLVLELHGGRLAELELAGEELEAAEQRHRAA